MPVSDLPKSLVDLIDPGHRPLAGRAVLITAARGQPAIAARSEVACAEPPAGGDEVGQWVRWVGGEVGALDHGVGSEQEGPITEAKDRAKSSPTPTSTGG